MCHLEAKLILALRSPAIHPEGNAIHGLVEGTISPEMEGLVRGVSFAGERQPPRAFPSGQTRFSPDKTVSRVFPSGQTALSPDETMSKCRCSGQSHDIPDGMAFLPWKSLRFGQIVNEAGGKKMSRIYGRIIEQCLWVVLFEDFLYFCGRVINTDNLKIFIYGI